MTREPDWLADIRDAMRDEPWSLQGPDRLVKVVRMATMINVPALSRAVGYVTQERYLLGKMPVEIERALGLPPFSLGRGCRVFRLRRLPLSWEYTYELSAAQPDGLAFDPGVAWEARARYVEDQGLTEVPYYPPGDPNIPQWKVTVAIPLVHLATLPPLIAYPRQSVR